MIKTETKKGASVKEIRKREAEQREKELRERCETLAIERYTKEKIAKWSNANKGLWFLPILDEDGEKIEALAIMRPITRSILSYASTKIQDEGLYEFLEVAMRECFVEGDQCILDDDNYFIPAANQFNKILEGKKAALLKR
jgi:hypothetical protein